MCVGKPSRIVFLVRGHSKFQRRRASICVLLLLSTVLESGVGSGLARRQLNVLILGDWQSKKASHAVERVAILLDHAIVDGVAGPSHQRVVQRVNRLAAD